MADQPTNQGVTFQQLHRPLWDRLIDLCLAQTANRVIRPKNREALSRHEKLAIDMRESLEYRFSAVRFHVALIHQFQKRGLQELTSSFLGGDSSDTVFTARRQQQMLFDAAIFNILALFDYVGNAIGFSFHGMDSAGAKWKWKKAVQFAKDGDGEEKKHGTRRYSTSAVAPIVEKVDREWINRLEEYRAELIHYKTDPASGKHSFHFAQGEPVTVRLEITTAPAFTKWVPMPGKSRGEQVSIVEAANWLMLQTHSSALAIVDALVIELESDPAPECGGLRVIRKR